MRRPGLDRSWQHGRGVDSLIAALAAPTRQAVEGLAATELGLVHIDIFKAGGVQIVDQATVVDSGLPSNFRDFGVGVIHKVWGWQTAVRKARTVAT